MRTSRADREPAIDALKVAYVQGRLTKDEFDERLGRALAPLTHAELAALTGDLPDGVATAGRPRGADQDMTRLREGNRAEARVLATLVAGVTLVALIGNGIGSPLHVLAIVLLLSPVWMLALGGVLLLHARPAWRRLTAQSVQAWRSARVWLCEPVSSGRSSATSGLFQRRVPDCAQGLRPDPRGIRRDVYNMALLCYCTECDLVTGPVTTG